MKVNANQLVAVDKGAKMEFEDSRSFKWIMTEIILTPEHVKRLFYSYKVEYPRECCGVLLGVGQDGVSRVNQVIQLVSSIATPGGFAISDHEMYRAKLLAKEYGLKCLAFYHSHVRGGTRLSEGDLASLRYSELPWIIMAHISSSNKFELAAYDAGTCTQVLVRISDP